MNEYNSIYTVIVTALTVLGSAGAWTYYERRARRKELNDTFMKDDCRERIIRYFAVNADWF